MKNHNICKLISPSSYDSLEMINFIYETDYETMTASITLSAHRMILILQGEGIMHFNNHVLSFAPGNLIFGFKDSIFSVSPKSQTPVEYMYISFRGGRSDELFRRFGIRPSSCYYQGFDGLIPMWKNSLSRAVEDNIDLTAESILLYTFSKFDTNHSAGNETIHHIVKLTEDYFSDSELSLAIIAEQLNYNAKYLSHLFKEKMGISYSEYLRNRRIEYAITLFEHGLDSVKNVALLSGFKDPLYFSSVFKKTVGISPAEYKKESSALQ